MFDIQNRPAARRHAVKDQRRSPRLEVLGQLDGHVVSLDHQVRMRDLSLGGFAAESEKPFRPGSIHRFRITTNTGAATELWVRAAYCRHQGTGEPARFLTGFEFMRAEKPGVRGAIDAIIDSVTGGITFS
jgi:hypothetical protein